MAKTLLKKCAAWWKLLIDVRQQATSVRFEDCCSERMKTEKLLQISEFQSGNREILHAARLPLTSTYINIQNLFCCPQFLRLMPDWDGYGSGPRMLPATPPAAVGGGFPTSSDSFCVASSHQLHALPNWAIGRHQWAHAFLSHRPKNLEWVQMDHSPIAQRKVINLWWLDYKLIRP